MKILRRKLIDKLSETDEIIINNDFEEGSYTIDIKDEYETVLEKLEGKNTAVFMPEEILERELNKRFVDLVAQAGITRLLLILEDNDQLKRENEILIKYVKEYPGFDYMIIQVPSLMDELYHHFMEGRIPKVISPFSISSEDAYEIIEHVLEKSELGNEVISLSINYFEDSALYREVYDQPDHKVKMNQLKTNDFKKISAHKLTTWHEFVVARKLN